MYKSVWDPFLDDTFTTKHDRANSHDKYAIAVMPRSLGLLPYRVAGQY